MIPGAPDARSAEACFNKPTALGCASPIELRKGAMLSWAADSSIREAPSPLVAAYLGGLRLEQFRGLPSGFVAGGDSTSASDTDVLALSDNPPKALTHRLELLIDAQDIAPGVERIGWTTEEWARRKAQGDGVVDIPRRQAALRAEAPSPIAPRGADPRTLSARTRGASPSAPHAAPTARPDT